MSVQINPLFDQLSNVSNQKNLDDRTYSTGSSGISFADFLKETTTNNIALFNPGTQLDFPEGAQAKEFGFPQAEEESYHEDPSIDNEQSTHSEEDHDAQQDAANSENDQHESTYSQAAVIHNPLLSETQQTTSSKDFATQRAGLEISGDPNQQKANEVQQKLAELTKAANATAQNQTDTTKATQANPNNTGNGNTNLNVTVTQEATVVAKAQSNLNSTNSITAQSGRETIADMLLASSEENAALSTNPATAAKNKTANANGLASSGENNTQSSEQKGQVASTLSTQAALNGRDTAKAAPQGAMAQAAPAASLGNIQNPRPIPTPTMAAPIPDGDGITSSSFQSDSATSSTSIGNTSSTQAQNGNGTVKSAQANAHRPTVPHKVISDQVSVNIQRAAAQNQDKINIQLRPQDLGRIEVTMELAKEGKMTAVITADKQETLDMLKQDSSSLLQSLNDAGLQANSNSLSFNLGGNQNSFEQFGNNNAGKSGPEKDFSLDGEDGTEIESTSDKMLGLGEIAQPNADGSYDFAV